MLKAGSPLRNQSWSKGKRLKLMFYEIPQQIQQLISISVISIYVAVLVLHSPFSCTMPNYFSMPTKTITFLIFQQIIFYKMKLSNYIFMINFQSNKNQAYFQIIGPVSYKNQLTKHYIVLQYCFNLSYTHAEVEIKNIHIALIACIAEHGRTVAEYGYWVIAQQLKLNNVIRIQQRFILSYSLILYQITVIRIHSMTRTINQSEEDTMKEELLTDNERSTRTRTTLSSHNPNQNNERPKAKNIKGTFMRLFQYTMKYKLLVTMANIGMLVSSGGMILLPMLCGIIIDHIKDEQSLTQDAIKFLILTVTMAFFSALRGYCFNLLGEKIVRDLRIELFKKLVQKDVSYYDKNKTGELISRLTSDVSTVESAASDNISILLRNLIQFFGSLFFLFLISWQLTTFIIVVTPIISFVIIFIIKIMKKLKKEYQNTLAFANSLANQVFGNIRVVRSFSNESVEHQNYASLLEKTYKTGRKRSFIYSIMLLTMTLFGNFLILSILYFGGKLTIDGELSIGDLASFVLYTVTLTVGFSSVSGIINQIVSALGVCEILFGIMDEQVTIVNGKQKAVLDNCEYIIEFRNVTFAYPTKPDVKVLNNFNLKIKKGESIALVGASGCGKSSVISLILRFYDVQQGEILIGNTNIKNLDLDSLRRQMGFVSQEPTLFSGSLKENVEYGLDNSEKSDEKVTKALQIANAKSFALNTQTFPDKLDTLVGERGVKLSGGQKQRIAIARSVIKDPKILIFDEATSALDAESEGLVQQAIDNLVSMKQNTMIVVAHRLSTIINCDRIAVIKQGKVVEDGTHWDLLKNHSFYKALVEKQISGYTNMIKGNEEPKNDKDK